MIFLTWGHADPRQFQLVENTSRISIAYLIK
jgi:hypothetical protein